MMALRFRPTLSFNAVVQCRQTIELAGGWRGFVKINRDNLKRVPVVIGSRSTDVVYVCYQVHVV